MPAPQGHPSTHQFLDPAMDSATQEPMMVDTDTHGSDGAFDFDALDRQDDQAHSDLRHQLTLQGSTPPLPSKLLKRISDSNNSSKYMLNHLLTLLEQSLLPTSLSYLWNSDTRS